MTDEMMVRQTSTDLAVVDLSKNVATLTERVVNVVEELKRNSSTTEKIAVNLTDLRMETVRYQQRNDMVDTKIMNLEREVAANKIESLAQNTSLETKLTAQITEVSLKTKNLENRLTTKVSVKFFSNTWSVILGIIAIVEGVAIIYGNLKLH